VINQSPYLWYAPGGCSLVIANVPLWGIQMMQGLGRELNALHGRPSQTLYTSNAWVGVSLCVVKVSKCLL
jgi:hypothetical protein